MAKSINSILYTINTQLNTRRPASLGEKKTAISYLLSLLVKSFVSEGLQLIVAQLKYSGNKTLVNTEAKLMELLPMESLVHDNFSHGNSNRACCLAGIVGTF